MFDKLKKKFILINMLLLTTTFILIFGTIYSITYIQNEKELEMNLRRAIHEKKKPEPGTPNMAGSIIIDLDSKNNLANIYTVMEIENSSIEEMISDILNNNKDLGKIKIEGNSYGYLKEQTPKGTRIVIINRQPQKDMLNNLLEIFLIVGSFSLGVLFLISLYLTNRSIKPIKETFDKQKQFIADASHELKTPLAIIKTNASVILANKEATVKSQLKWIKYINDQTERMSKLIEEMLSLAKLDAEKEIGEFALIDLSNLLNNILLTFEAIIFEHNINLETNISEKIYIKGDVEGIRKAVVILLDNAIKYSSKHGEINIWLKEEKNKAKIVIKNRGEGIKPEYLEKIFERFYRVDESRIRETGGYGLGLPIAKSIVEKHKGKLYAESKLGKDTTFTIELNSVHNS